MCGSRFRNFRVTDIKKVELYALIVIQGRAAYSMSNCLCLCIMSHLLYTVCQWKMSQIHKPVDLKTSMFSTCVTSWPVPIGHCNDVIQPITINSLSLSSTHTNTHTDTHTHGHTRTRSGIALGSLSILISALLQLAEFVPKS